MPPKRSFGRRYKDDLLSDDEEEEEKKLLAKSPEVCQSPIIPSGGLESSLQKVPLPAIQREPTEPDLNAAFSEENQATIRIGENQVGQVFGITKEGLARATIRFLCPPSSYPLSVSFQFAGVFLTHRYVMAMVKGLLVGWDDAKITSIRFVDRNVMLGTRNLENRWVVTVGSLEVKNHLINCGLEVVNRKIPIRSYDDVLKEDYEDFMDFIMYQRHMGMKSRYDPLYAEEEEEGAQEDPCAEEENVSIGDAPSSPEPEEDNGGPTELGPKHSKKKKIKANTFVERDEETSTIIEEVPETPVPEADQ